MNAIRRAGVASLLFVAAACASASGGSAVLNGPARWTGSFKPSTLNSELGRAAPNRGFGTIMLTPSATDPGSMRVELSISAPVQDGERVAWAVLSGPCGSASPMITGQDQFPTIEIASNGNGTLRSTMPIAMDSHGSYHANVYWSDRSRDLNDVMMCANLAFGRG